MHCFNLARTLSHRSLQALKRFHFHFVNPSVFRVSPKLMEALAKLDDECLTVRVAILCHAYMCDASHHIARGQYYLANGVA